MLYETDTPFLCADEDLSAALKHLLLFTLPADSTRRMAASDQATWDTALGLIDSAVNRIADFAFELNQVGQQVLPSGKTEPIYATEVLNEVGVEAFDELTGLRDAFIHSWKDHVLSGGSIPPSALTALNTMFVTGHRWNMKHERMQRIEHAHTHTAT